MTGFGVDTYGVGVYGLFSGVTTDQIILDPSEVAEARTALNINGNEIRVGEDGPDWGEAAIEAFMAEQEIGQVPADFRYPNRIVRIPLLLGAEGDPTNWQTARRQLQMKVSLFQQEGGWVRRNNYYADVVNASLTMPDKFGFLRYEADVVLTLECLPDFYGDEITLASHVEVVNPTLISVETAILGDMPGRVTIAVNEFQGQLQRGIVWGFRSRHYSSQDTAQLRYRAQDMDRLDVAAETVLAGSASGTVVRHPTVGRAVVPILSTDIIPGDGALTHTGSYRVLARVHTSSTLAALENVIQMRFVWDVGDLVAPTENDWWPFTSYDVFQIADLGEIHLVPPAVGAHRWRGQFQAICNSEDGFTAPVSIDEVWFVPISEGTGLIRASSENAAGGFTEYAALGLSYGSETAGALNGKAMSRGGTWATSGGSPDFTEAVGAEGSYAYRQNTGDADDVGRLALAGTDTATELTNQVLFTFLDLATPNESPVACLYQRWTDDTHNVHVRAFNFAGVGWIYVYARNGGAFERVGVTTIPVIGQGQTRTFVFTTDVQGNFFCWCRPFYGGNQALGEPDLAGNSPLLLASGSTLSAGRHGFRDFYTGSTANSRIYSWYAANVPTADAVMYPGRALEIRTDGVFRESEDGAAFGAMQDVEGDLPRIPTAGMEGRATELFLKASRGNFKGLPDNGVDNIVATIRYRPSHLFPR